MPWTHDGVGTNPHPPTRRQPPGDRGQNGRRIEAHGSNADYKSCCILRNSERFTKREVFFKALLVQMPSVALRSAELIVAFLIVGCLVCSVRSTVAGGSGTPNDRGIAVSLLDYDHILLSEGTDIDQDGAHNLESHFPERKASSDSSNSRPISLDGFNLLWLIASKLEANDKLIRIEQSANDSSVSSPTRTASTGDDAIPDGVYLDSAWPRPYLRYGKKHAPISRVIASDTTSDIPPALAPGVSEYLDTAAGDIQPAQRDKTPSERPHSDLYEDNIVRINRFIAGSSIGFEMEFRVERHSGSGYIITGRSLVGQPFFGPSNAAKHVNESSDRQSWFGLYSHARATSYSLRLEYRNFAWHRNRQLQIRFTDNFRKGEWQKLAVNIDFNANTINYWVNCSARPLVQLRANISHPSSFYSVYRLVQHRRSSTVPVKVTFRVAVVTDGHRRSIPRQCDSERMTVCTGGKIYMPCGPSCEKTCRGIHEPEITDDYLRTCAIACVSGCHCRPGYVSNDGRCLKPTQCPCMIGSKSYEGGTNLTINNEICACIKGQWKCHRPPELTQTPRNLTMTAGRSGQISCGVAGNPQPTISWEGPDGATFRAVSKDYGRLSILVLLNATAKEAGLYRCRASLAATGWEKTATSSIRIISRPVITLPQTILVTRGQPILAIDCVASGLPRPLIRWTRENPKARKRTVIPSERLEIYRGTTGVVRLKIHNVRTTDAGVWTCLAYNNAGRVRANVKVFVRLPEPNSMAFHRKPVDQYVKRGHTAMFNCEILNRPSASMNVTWLKDGVRVNFTSKRIATKQYRLVIRQVQDEDAGVYMCIVKVRRVGRELRAKAELMIKGRMLPWSDWSHCNSTCGGGIMFKRRTCTGIPPNDKTCHGKRVHIKSCSTQACPGVCSAVGDPHYTTFDGRRFNFHGDCGYVLSHDAIGYEFKVLLYNGECGTGLSCLNSVTVILSLPGLASVVDIQRDGFVTVNSVLVSLPYMSPGTPLVIDKVGLYIILNAGPDFELKWALPHRLYLIVGPKYFGRTQGFCGNYNSYPYDDNILRSGRSVRSDLEFGLDWAVSEGNIDRSCSAFVQHAQPCNGDLLLRKRASICEHLLDRSTFGACHSRVSPFPFMQSCQFDICRTSIKRQHIYFCTALAAYAEECLRNGLVLDWRKDDVCPKTCFSGKVYEECGPRCVRYCPGVVNESGRVCSSNERCISGCHCPRDKVLHKGRCVTKELCPCVEGGRQFENNATSNRNCEKCICLGGKWKCSFNKALCEFPSSVIRGPISQVVPSGRSVSFCCEAAGIPLPDVEWYRDGRLIPPQTRADPLDIDRISTTVRGPVHGYETVNFYIENITREDAGTYYCRATNALGSQISESAVLKVVEPWVTSCNLVPTRRIVNLPDGCVYEGENFLDVGYCPSLPCFYEGSSGLRRKKRCGGTKQCCRPSSLQPVSVSCNHADYAFSFHITTITQCSCAICESRYTIVEGALLTAITGKLLSHVKIDFQGRVVGYTSDTGSFSLRFYSLPDEARYVALTFTDIMYKRFPATVKNLPIITGETTTHKVLINGRGFNVRFDSSLGLRHMLRSVFKRSERLRLIIPPSSLILQQAEEPYAGQAQAVISIVERDYKIDSRRLHIIPGNFLGIDRREKKQILLPSYVISVSLFSKYGRSLELLPGKSATFLVTTISFGERMQPWVLDELTGLWRESLTKVQMEPHFNKRGEKILQLTAKIPRLNTAWALSDSEDACYVRVQALDNDNNTVAGVRVVMTTTGDIPRISATRSRKAHSSTSQMQTLVESLTRSTDTNGLCMPLGCTKFGFITASRLESELTPLPPDKPPTEMGRIITTRSPEYGVANAILQTINIFDSNFLDDLGETPTPSTALYFHSEHECRTTAADKRTYIFRDNSQSEVNGYEQASRTAASKSTTRVIPIPRVPERRPLVGRRGKTYCHIKVSVMAPEHLTYTPRRSIGTLMILEAVTFSGLNTTGDMSILGWRRAPFRTPVRRTSFSRYGRYRLRTGRVRLRRVPKEICVEYICGDDEPADMVYVAVKPAKDGYSRTSAPLECRFNRAANNTQEGLRPQIRPGSTTDFSKGGYVLLPTAAEIPSRARYYHRHFPKTAFPGASVQESKGKCLAARGHDHISAWVGCS